MTVAQPPCFQPKASTEPHKPSNNAAIEAAMSSTYINAVSSLRKQVQHFIDGPTPLGLEAILGAAKSVLQEEFKRLKSTSTL